MSFAISTGAAELVSVAAGGATGCGTAAFVTAAVAVSAEALLWAHPTTNGIAARANPNIHRQLIRVFINFFNKIRLIAFPVTKIGLGLDQPYSWG